MPHLQQQQSRGLCLHLILETTCTSGDTVPLNKAPLPEPQTGLAGPCLRPTARVPSLGPCSVFPATQGGQFEPHAGSVCPASSVPGAPRRSRWVPGSLSPERFSEGAEAPLPRTPRSSPRRVWGSGGVSFPEGEAGTQPPEAPRGKRGHLALRARALGRSRCQWQSARDSSTTQDSCWWATVIFFLTYFS